MSLLRITSSIRFLKKKFLKFNPSRSLHFSTSCVIMKPLSIFIGRRVKALNNRKSIPYELCILTELLSTFSEDDRGGLDA